MRKLLVGIALALAGFLAIPATGNAGLPVPLPSDLPTDLPTDVPPPPEICNANPINAVDLPALIPADIVQLCELIGKTILDTGVGAVVQPAGNGVYAEGHDSTGAGQEFGIETNADGTVLLRFVGDEAADNTPKAIMERLAASAPCDDGSNSLVGYKEKDTRKWFLNRGSIPGSLGADRTAKAITSGSSAVPSQANDCNEPKGLNIRQEFKGKTSKRGNLDSNANCTNPDGTSVTDFGAIPVAGRTCAWYAIEDGRDRVVEGDIRLNKNQRWTFTPNQRCSNRLDLQATVTHETGHAFGLGHVGHDHINLTMTEFLPTCTAGPRTLGLGDLRGLRNLYN